MANIIVRGNELVCGDLHMRCAIGKGGTSAHKKEGDGCTPLGSFPLRECWYRADRFSAPETSLPLKLITPRDGWCDDPKSPRYNRHITIPLFCEETDFNPYMQIPPKEQRNHMSDAQKTLWRHLRTPRFSAYGFHRQYCMNGRYIIIVCFEKKLIIEADGETHDDSAESRARDAYLESEGFRILRFQNRAIAKEMPAILDQIQKALESQRVASAQEIYADVSQSEAIPRCERLWRDDLLYDLIVPLGYNDNPPVPGKGSAIFLHVAGKNYEPTEGCVAVAFVDLVTLLGRCKAGTMIEIKGAD